MFLKISLLVIAALIFPLSIFSIETLLVPTLLILWATYLHLKKTKQTESSS